MEGNSGLENRENQTLGRDFIRIVEDRFNVAFGEVLGERKPEVHVEPFFSYHKIPEDLEGLKEQIVKADVYIPEIFGWTANQLGILRASSAGKISLGALTSRLRIYRSVFRKIAEDVYNSHKAITIIDVPARHRLIRESRNAWTYNPSYGGDYAEVLDYTRSFLDNLANYHNQREGYILEQITAQKIEELLTTYQELGSKQSIEILMSMGLGHSLMPLGFHESYFTDQGIMARRVNREVDDDLAARIYLESFFDTAIYSVYPLVLSTMDTRRVAAFKRRLIGELNIEDARRIFNYRKSEGITPRAEFDRIFDEKHINLPDNEEEIDEFLARS